MLYALWFLIKLLKKYIQQLLQIHVTFQKLLMIIENCCIAIVCDKKWRQWQWKNSDAIGVHVSRQRVFGNGAGLIYFHEG